MKRSAPTPVQVTTQIEAPCLSIGVIRTALIGLVAVMLLLTGLFCFLRARVPQAVPLAAPKAMQTSDLRMAKMSAIAPISSSLR